MQTNSSSIVMISTSTEVVPDVRLSKNITSFVLPFLVFVLFFIYLRQQKSKEKSKDGPPLVPGLPFLGSAIDFQNRAVDFLHECRRNFGDLFTLNLPFNRLHFLMDIHSLDLFTKHRNFDFDPIQAMVNRNVFNMSLPNARQCIRDVSLHTRKSQMIEVVERYACYIEETFTELATKAGNRKWSSKPLHELLIETQFRGIFNTIFGRSDDGDFNAVTVSKCLDRFHKAFNFLWLGFPCWLFPDPHRAFKQMIKAHPPAEELIKREDASLYIRNATQRLIESGGTPEVIIGHSLVFTHINYNTVKITYWALAQLAAHPEAITALREEAESLLEAGKSDEDDTTDLQLSDLLNLPVLDSVVKETFRMSSGVLMVREVTETVSFQPRCGKAYTLTKGDKVAMYPPAVHLDGEIFENPMEYRYDRFIGEDFYKDGLRVNKPILAYGSLCPGQQMSIAQVKFFILSFVTSFDFRFDQGVPVYNRNCYGHEILPAIQDLPISYAPRQDRFRLKLRFS